MQALRVLDTPKNLCHRNDLVSPTFVQCLNVLCPRCTQAIVAESSDERCENWHTDLSLLTSFVSLNKHSWGKGERTNVKRKKVGVSPLPLSLTIYISAT